MWIEYIFGSLSSDTEKKKLDPDFLIAWVLVMNEQKSKFLVTTGLQLRRFAQFGTIFTIWKTWKTPVEECYFK